VAEGPFFSTQVSILFQRCFYATASRIRSIALAVEEVATPCALLPYGHKLCSAVVVRAVVLKTPTGRIFHLVTRPLGSVLQFRRWSFAHSAFQQRGYQILSALER